MLKRTPLIAIFIAVIITIAINYFFELPERPFSTGQQVLLYFLSYFVGLGISLLFDPKAKETKNKYLKINFYED